jgi:F420-dependent oxidoreductase-like protein
MNAGRPMAIAGYKSGMRICLMIEGQEGVTWEQWMALARGCEEHGFDGLFRSDHYLSFSHPFERGTLDAWATLSALAALTERIRLGTLVSPVGFRHPSELAKAVLTVDHVSNGRVELGMGTGWFEPEHRAFGFPFPEVGDRFDQLEEQVEIVHRLWDRDEDAVTFEGKHYRLEAAAGLPQPAQHPHPPLILGGSAGPRAASLAARWADEYNVTFSTPEEVAAADARLIAAWEAAGRDPATVRLSMMTMFLIGEDRDDLRRRAERLMDRRGESGDPDAFLANAREGTIVGTPEEVLDLLGRYAAAGLDRVMLQHLVHEDLETLALVGSTLIPHAPDL